MIQTCVKTSETLADVKNQAVKIVSEPAVMSGDHEKFAEVQEGKRALTSFLTNHEVPVVSAWKMFTMERSLLLGFCNAAIPFTVMVITTAAQFKPAAYISEK